MCEFFSFCSDNEGKPLFFNAEQRKRILENIGEFENLYYRPDSHTSIAHYYGYLGEKEDLLGKYEYNPITKQFTVDDVGKRNHSKKMERWVKNLDFMTIAPELIIKPIICPFEIEPPEIEEKHIKLLKQWASIENSIDDSIWNSVWNSIWNLVGDSVGNLVWNSVKTSIEDSVRASIENSIDDSVWDSIWDSVGAYCSSFVNIKFIYDFSSVIKLWEQGLVPCADGEFWYLISKNGIEWKGKV